MEAAKKTPSPKVIASYMLREVLTNAPNNFDPERATSLVDSRVSDAKYEKVKEQFAKITEKFRQRIEATIGKFEGVPVVKKGKEKTKEKGKEKTKEKPKPKAGKKG